MSGFDVEIADLTQHAGSVDEINGRVGEAQSAAAGTDLSGDAFGIMCGFLSGSVTGNEQSNTTALTSMVAALEMTSSGVRAMADDYRKADEAAAARMGELLKAMDS